MRRETLVTLCCAGALLVGLASWPEAARALTCPSRVTFTQKVQQSKNVVIGEITGMSRDGRKVDVRLLRVLKDGRLFKVGQRSFQVNTSRYTSFGFKVRGGQIVLFFFGDRIHWSCNGPLLIR